MAKARKTTSSAPSPVRTAHPASAASANAASANSGGGLLDQPWLLAGLAMLLTAAVYWRVADFEFSDLDDYAFIVSNKHVMAGLGLEGLKWAFSLNSANYWQPLTWLSLMLDRSMFGDWAGGFHLTGALLHAANVGLLFFLALRWTGRRGVALLVALLLGLHPAHVESVAWVTERKDVLFLFFGLLSLHAYTSHARKPGAGLLGLWPCLLAYAASMAAKPMLVTLPALLLLVDFWPLRRIALFGQGGENAPKLGAVLLEKLPFLVLAAFGAALALHSHPTHYDSFDPGLGLKLANGAASYLDYLGILFFPHDLAAYHPFPTAVSTGKLTAALGVIALASGAALWQLRARPYLAVGWFWFLGTLTPVLLPPKVGMHVAYADRWAYFPAIGLYLALAMLAAQGLERFDASRRRTVALACGAALTALLALGATAQLDTWRNSTTLYDRILAVTEDNYFVLGNYGVLKMNEGDFSGAERMLRKALAANPDYNRARLNLGSLYVNMRRFAEAGAQLDQVLTKERDAETLGHAWYAKGLMLALQNRFDEAERCYQAALAQNANDHLALNDLGSIAMERRDYRQALGYFEKAAALDPNYEVARLNIARAKAALGAGG